MVTLIWDSIDKPDIKNEFGVFCIQVFHKPKSTKWFSPTTRAIAKGNKYQGIEAIY